MPRSRSALATEGLGQRLRALRLSKNLTQADLAAPQYTHAYVSTIEAGRRVPSDSAVAHFAAKLGVEPEEILTGRSSARVRELEVEIQRARADVSRGAHDAARHRLRKVIREAREYQAPRLEGRAEEVWALSDERRGDAAAALKRFDRAVRLYSDESPVAAASSVAGKIRTLQILGEEHHAIFVGEHYLDSLERGGLASPSVRLRVLSPMVLAYLAGGFTSQAGEVAEQCTRLMPRVNDPEALAIAHINVASVQQAEGHYDDASRSLHQAEQLFDALDLQQESGVVNLARGVIEVRRGKYDEGRRSLSRAIDLLEGTGNDVQRMNAELELGRLDRLVGELERSAERLESALGKLPPDGQGRLRAWGHRELGMSLAHLDPGEAEKNFLVAVDLYEQMDEPIELARTYAALADHRLSQGEKESALEAYRYAGSALEALPDM